MRFSAIVLSLQLRIDAANHHCLDVRQEFRAGQCVEPQGLGDRERGGHVQAQHRAGDDPQLAGEPQGQIPDLPAFAGQWAVQLVRALGAGAVAGSAVLVAPAEVPFGKGAETFFSASSSRPFET